MVKVNYFTEEKSDERDEILKTRENVKGLAKEFFGFCRVTDSIDDRCIGLNTFFNFRALPDIGVINVGTDSMGLFKRPCQQKAEQFAKAYQEKFMDDGKEFVIDCLYFQ